MQKSRTIFIGDVHGCFNELKTLINKLKLQKEDLVYFVGDIINKGPDSYKVLKYLYKNREQFKCVLGNNEVNFLNFLEGNFTSKHKKFNQLKKKIKKNKKNILIEYIKSFPLYIEEKKFLLIHGGLIPGKKISEHTESELTKTREYKGKLWYTQYKGKKKIIYGHNAIDGLQIREHTIGLDSGCVYGKSLTAYILETGEIYSQNAIDVYVDIYSDKKSVISKIKNIFNIK